MQKSFGRSLVGLAILLALSALFIGLYEMISAGDTAVLPAAITDRCKITLNGSPITARLTDDSESTYVKYASASVTVVSPEPIGGVYVKFDRTPPVWTLSEKNGEQRSFDCGTNGFLHEYEKIEEENVTEITMTFPSEVSIADLYVLPKSDTLPDFVQVWRPAEGKADVLLLIAHSDDDQLFFAGSVPDAVARGAEMQVCYFTNHWNTHTRPHELLNGLWTCGLDRYPVVGPFPDKKRVDTEEGELAIFEDLGFTYDDMVAEQIMLLRKYRPQIVLGHDINGEYGHGAHRLDSHSLRDAALISNDPTKYPESAALYGVWEVPKIYIHLYEENRIDFEIDVPLARFGGRTAYQVSQDAFRCHLSQFSSRYRVWLLGSDEKPITLASEFPMYSPRYYGLWSSTVGKDVIKTDFYENITLYKDQGGEDPPSSPTPTVAPTEPTTQAPTESPSHTETPPETSEVPTKDSSPDLPSETSAEPTPYEPKPKKPAVLPIVLCGAAVLLVAAAALIVKKRRK